MRTGMSHSGRAGEELKDLPTQKAPSPQNRVLPALLRPQPSAELQGKRKGEKNSNAVKLPAINKPSPLHAVYKTHAVDPNRRQKAQWLLVWRTSHLLPTTINETEREKQNTTYNAHNYQLGSVRGRTHRIGGAGRGFCDFHSFSNVCLQVSSTQAAPSWAAFSRRRYLLTLGHVIHILGDFHVSDCAVHLWGHSNISWEIGCVQFFLGTPHVSFWCGAEDRLGLRRGAELISLNSVGREVMGPAQPSPGFFLLPWQKQQNTPQGFATGRV